MKVTLEAASCERFDTSNDELFCWNRLVEKGIELIDVMTDNALEGLMEIYLEHSSNEDKEIVSESMYQIEHSDFLFDQYLTSVATVSYNKYLEGNQAEIYSAQSKLQLIKQRIAFLEDVTSP